MSEEITPGERRELRSVVRGQFKVLRHEVKRREAEMREEVETDLLERYREQDQAVHAFQAEVERIKADSRRQIADAAKALMEQHPDVDAGFTRYGDVESRVRNRAQVRAAALAAVPNRVGDALLALDKQENQLLRQLSEYALESETARGFLSDIPTVGQLVPRAVLAEIEAQITGETA